MLSSWSYRICFSKGTAGATAWYRVCLAHQTDANHSTLVILTGSNAVGLPGENRTFDFPFPFEAKNLNVGAAVIHKLQTRAFAVIERWAEPGQVDIREQPDDSCLGDAAV
jgi:hypothetical protein